MSCASCTSAWTSTATFDRVYRLKACLGNGWTARVGYPCVSPGYVDARHRKISAILAHPMTRPKCAQPLVGAGKVSTASKGGS